jgi:glycerophosphoryl diester phosphodiesterase
MAYRKYQRKDANGNICAPLTVYSQVVDEETDKTLEQTLLIINEQINDLEKRNNAEIPTFTGVVDSAEYVFDQSATQFLGVYYIKSRKVFAALDGDIYYTSWQAQGMFQSSKCYNQNGVAVENRIYYLKDMFDTENAHSLVFLKSGSFVEVSDNAEIEDLQTRVTTIEENAVTIVNDLTTGGADKALSAEMGKTLGVDTATETNNRLLYTEGKVAYDIFLPGGQPYLNHNLLLKGGRVYQFTIAIDDARETYVYSYINKLSDDSQIAALLLSPGSTKRSTSVYVAEDCYIKSYAASTSETLHITVKSSIANTQIVKKLSSTKENKRFVNAAAATTGVVTTTSKELGVYTVDVKDIGNIHVYEENIDSGNLVIAFYDNDGAFIDSVKVVATDTNDKFVWFCSDVPSNATTAKVTAFYGNGEPIIGTLDNRAVSHLEKEVERIQEEKVSKDDLGDKIIGGKLIYSNEFTDISTSYNGKVFDVSSYANGTQFLFRVHSASINNSSKKAFLCLGMSGVKKDIPFSAEGDIWIEKTESLTQINVYLSAPISGNTNSLSYSLTAMTVAKMLHRQENAYVKVPSLDVGTNWQNGYYTQLYPPQKTETKEWLTLPIQYSNGFKIHVDADFTTYVVALKYWMSNQGVGIAQELLHTSAFDFDLSNVVAWTLQVRRIDRAHLDPAVGNEAVTIELIDGGVYEKPQTKREVLETLNSSSELEQIIANKANTIQESLSSLKKQTIDSVNFPMPSPNLYGHLFIERIYLSSNPAIPCQSVFDVAVTARMGFKMIEANVLVTADGIQVTGHQTSVDGVSGYLQTLQDLNGNPVSVKIEDITFEELRTNYRYKSKYSQYRTPITSLEEFLLACKRFNITPFVQVAYPDITIPLVESIVGKSYVAYGGSRAKTDVTIYTYSKGTIDELLAQCDKIGAPFILGVNANSLDGFTDEEVKMLVEGVHNRGCRIGWAGSYHSQKNNLRYHELGLDINASGWDVPDFTEADEVNAFGNEVRGFKDFGKDQTGVLTLLSGESLSVPAEQRSIISKASLHIHYKGELRFNFGHNNINAEALASDGLKEMVITSVIEDKAPLLNITATADTEIYSISYKVASVV